MASQLALFGGKKKPAKKRRPRAKPASTWALFTKRNMSAFMASYGSHAAAMRALGVAWRKQKPAKKKPAKKRKAAKKPAKKPAKKRATKKRAKKAKKCSRVSVKAHARKCPKKKRRTR